MGPADAIVTCIRKFFTFSGRARRPEFWWFWASTVAGGCLLLAVVSTVVGPEVTTETVITTDEHGTAVEEVVETLHYSGGLIGSIYGIAIFFPLLSASWRRMHDVGRPGWLVVLPHIIVVVGFAITAGIAISTGAIRETAPGSWELESTIPLVGGGLTVMAMVAAAVFVFVCLVSGTQHGPNRFGPEPSANGVER